VYRSFLSGPVSRVVPEPTREAVFQLFCDIRANVPKDKRFLQRHAKAFTPQTSVGWLALAGVLGYAVSGALLLTTLTLGISVAGLSMGLMAVLATGAFLASALGFMAFVLFTSAFVVGAVAFTALSGYVVGSSSLAVMKHITQLVFGGNGAVSAVQMRSASPSEEDQMQQTSTSIRTTISAAPSAPLAASPASTLEEEKPTTTRPSTYAAPRAVLPPIKTASPTKKKNPTVAVTTATASASSAPAAMTTPDAAPIGIAQREGVEQHAAAILSPESSTSTSTTAKEVMTTLTAEAAVAPASVVEETPAVSLSEKEAEKVEGELPSVPVDPTPTPMNNTTNIKKPAFVAIKTNDTTPSGSRTITMIKANSDNKKKTSSPAPLPGPPPSTAGLLKPISPATASTIATTTTTTTTAAAAQEASSSLSSSVSTPIVNSTVDTIDANDSPGAFTSVMQGWKEIEKKAAMESPNGGAPKLPLPNRSKSKSKSSNSRKASSPPGLVVGGEALAVSTLDPKTPET
jgi:hypothetical protein